LRTGTVIGFRASREHYLKFFVLTKVTGVLIIFSKKVEIQNYGCAVQ